MRLLIVLEQTRPTGLVRQLVELMDGLSRAHVEPHLVCVARTDDDVAPLLQLLTEKGLQAEVVREAFPFDPRPIGKIRASHRRIKPDVLQTHGYKGAAYAYLLKPLLDTVWVAFYHGRTTTDWKVRGYHALETRLMRAADAVVPVASGVEKHLGGVDPERICVIPNALIPLPESSRTREEVRADLGLSPEQRVVGFVGRLSQEKGPDLFNSTVRTLHEDDQRFVGLVAGDGPMLPNLDSREGAGGDVIRYEGHVAEVADMYRAMDVLLISSRSEVFPNVLLEAIDAAVPVAATPVGGIPAVAAGLETVALAENLSVGALVDAVRRALASASSVALARTRARIRERYSQDARVGLAVNLYRHLLHEQTYEITSS